MSNLVRRESKEPLAIRNIPSRRNKTKIELYNLTELVLDKYLNDNFGYPKIADFCNEELCCRNDGISYRKISTSNVSNYLKKVKDKIAIYEGEKFREAINNIGIIDKVKHLSSLIQESWERESILKEDMTEAFETHDHERFYKSISAIQSNENLINQMIKTLATIESKLTTCVTIEFVKSLAMKLTNVVADSDLIQGEQKEKIIVEMSNHINFGD